LVLPQEETLTLLQSTPLFRGVNEEELEKFVTYCKFEQLSVGETIIFNARFRDEIPIVLVTKGCVALHTTTVYGTYKRIVLALVMPTQLVYEFQFLGDPLPESSSIVPIDETDVVSFYPNRFEALIKTQPVIMRNLAQTMMFKQNISNFHLEAVSQTKGGAKIATMLSGFFRLNAWRPPDYDDLRLKQEMQLSIMWSIDLITRYLSCDVRTARGGLVELIKAGLIKVQWFDDELMPIENVSAQDVRDLGRKGGRLHEETYFRISILKPNRLEEYCGG